MQLKPGLKLKAPGTGAEVIVIQAPTQEVDLTCAGSPMSPDGGEGQAPGPGEALLIGKRYATADGALEVLCSAGGTGPLAVGGEVLAVKQAKALPSSD